MSDTPAPTPAVVDAKPVTTVVEKTTGQPSTVTTTSVQPGWRTSEFWTAVVVVVAGAVMAIYGTMKDKDAAVDRGMTLMGAGGVGYAISRGLAKRPA